jgi:hypothetical protein
VDECDAQVCDDSSVGFDPSECEIETCDPDNVNFDADECDAQVCDSSSVNYDATECAIERCDKDNVNYDPSVCPACGYTSRTIQWGSENYSSSGSNGSSITNLDGFVVNYEACADYTNNVWRLGVVSISGNVTITVATGGSRNPYTFPPVNQTEAVDAVSVMQGYYSRGGRGTWHTEAASKAHEEYHYSQLKCANEHYWPDVQLCLYNNFTVPLSSYNDKTSALAALMALDPDAKVTAMHDAAYSYVVSLGDSANTAPYAAGQSVLNSAIIYVQGIAATNSWSVPSGTTSVTVPSAPCTATYTTITCP